MSLNVAENLKGLGNKISVDHNSENIKKIRLIDEVSGQHVVRIDIEPDLNSFDDKRYNKGALSKFDALVISDYDKGYITPDKIRNVLSVTAKLKIPVFVDSKKEDLSCFEGCVIKINEKEYKKIKRLPRRRQLVVTMGKEGCQWRRRIFPAVETEVHDVCGAGDTFLAGLVHMYLTTKGDMVKSIKFANKCAAINVRHLGTYTITQEALNDIRD